MTSAAARRLSFTVAAVVAFSTACSGDRQEDPCRTAPSVIMVTMGGQSSDTTVHVVKTGGAVNIARVSRRDTVSFEPMEGLSPATVERDNYLAYVAERAGSYTVTEVDGVGRNVATVRLAVQSC